MEWISVKDRMPEQPLRNWPKGTRKTFRTRQVIRHSRDTPLKASLIILARIPG